MTPLVIWLRNKLQPKFRGVKGNIPIISQFLWVSQEWAQLGFAFRISHKLSLKYYLVCGPVKAQYGQDTGLRSFWLTAGLCSLLAVDWKPFSIPCQVCFLIRCCGSSFHLSSKCKRQWREGKAGRSHICLHSHTELTSHSSAVFRWLETSLVLNITSFIALSRRRH